MAEFHKASQYIGESLKLPIQGFILAENSLIARGGVEQTSVIVKLKVERTLRTQLR